MGCGCRKNKNNRKSRLKVLYARTNAERSAVTSAFRSEKAERKKLIEKKAKICKSCPQSKQTPKERRERTKVCHKSMTSLQSILNKADFKCPLGKF